MSFDPKAACEELTKKINNNTHNLISLLLSLLFWLSCFLPFKICLSPSVLFLKFYLECPFPHVYFALFVSLLPSFFSFSLSLPSISCSFFLPAPSIFCSFLFWDLYNSTWISFPSSAPHWPTAELPQKLLAERAKVPSALLAAGETLNSPPALSSHAAAHLKCRRKHSVQCVSVFLGRVLVFWLLEQRGCNRWSD